MFWWDSSYILVIIGAIICAIASANVNGTYKKYSKKSNMRGMTGRDAAQYILNNAGIYDVRIDRVAGKLTDYYSPSENVLRLSESVYDSTSVAAIGVAAHECGHAIQQAEGYGPLKIRTVAVPVANIGSYVSWPLILIGILFGLTQLSILGVFAFTFVVAFQLITLPVEFNASERALKALEKGGILGSEEMDGAGKVLKAAALTYVAALFSSILQLARLILISRSGSGRRRRG